LAALLQPGSGTTLCFTAADMMVPDMSAAFYQAVLDYVNDPGSLTSLLRGLQTTERGAGPSPDSNRACATP
jgi:alpha-glucoside transport system substrate-binding protein